MISTLVLPNSLYCADIIDLQIIIHSSLILRYCLNYTFVQNSLSYYLLYLYGRVMRTLTAEMPVRSLNLDRETRHIHQPNISLCIGPSGHRHY